MEATWGHRRHNFWALGAIALIAPLESVPMWITFCGHDPPSVTHMTQCLFIVIREVKVKLKVKAAVLKIFHCVLRYLHQVWQSDRSTLGKKYDKIQNGGMVDVCIL